MICAISGTMYLPSRVIPLAALALAMSGCTSQQEETDSDGVSSSAEVQSGQPGCQFPLVAPMAPDGFAWKKLVFSYHLQTGECSLSVESPADSEDPNVFVAYFGQYVEEGEDTYAWGEVSYQEGWKAAYGSQGIGQCVSHNFCEQLPDIDTLAVFETDDERQADDAWLAWMEFRFDSTTTNFTLSDFHVVAQ